MLDCSRRLQFIAWRTSAFTLMTRSSANWVPSTSGWYKLNSNATRSKIDGRASYGGLIRDHHGSWKIEFSKFIVICSSLERNYGEYIPDYDVHRT
ncbi:hypothetical protein V6N13_103841 [Hibiscus sabdariffa]